MKYNFSLYPWILITYDENGEVNGQISLNIGEIMQYLKKSNPFLMIDYTYEITPGYNFTNREGYGRRNR